TILQQKASPATHSRNEDARNSKLSETAPVEAQGKRMMRWVLRVTAVTMAFSVIALLAAPRDASVEGSIGAVDVLESAVT
ncbi:MAG: hypothetical protein AB7P20_09185, partial [Rhizobiaceae bacterium]